MAIQAGATALEKAHGGRGVLLGGVPGVMPGKVVVIGGGVVGFNAAQMAVGLGADVTIFDRDPDVLERLDNHFEGRARTLFSGKAALAALVAKADLVIGAVLIPGAAAPKLVTRDMLSTMKAICCSLKLDFFMPRISCLALAKPNGPVPENASSENETNLAKSKLTEPSGKCSSWFGELHQSRRRLLRWITHSAIAQVFAV